MFVGTLLVFFVAYRMCAVRFHVLTSLACFVFAALSSVYVAGKIAESLWLLCGRWTETPDGVTRVAESEDVDEQR
jgi:hypothetical protein